LDRHTDTECHNVYQALLAVALHSDTCVNICIVADLFYHLFLTSEHSSDSGDSSFVSTTVYVFVT